MIRAEPHVHGVVGGDDGAVASREGGATVPAMQVVTGAPAIMNLAHHEGQS